MTKKKPMSISDSMVVLGLWGKTTNGLPQVMYNNPKNSFVAKFLGNPPNQHD